MQKPRIMYLFRQDRKVAFLIALQFALVFLGCLAFPFSSRALVVSPARIEIEVDPGGSARGNISLVNDKDQAQTFYSSVQNFEAGGESGVPRFVDDKEGLVEWVKVAKEISIEPGKRAEIPFEIQSPKDAGVGGHFAAIFWGTEPPQASGSGNVSIGAKVGSLLFLRVKGDVVEKGEIVEFRSVSKKKVFSQLPVDFVFRFENSGNDRLKPAGNIEIYNIFGSKSETLAANKAQGSVLPESVRRFFVSWGRENIGNLEADFEKDAVPDEKKPFIESVKSQLADFHLGKYNAVLNMTYGLDEKQVQSKYSFYIFPWELLILLLGIFVLFIILGRIGLKRYHKRIIKKYSNLQNQNKNE